MSPIPAATRAPWSRNIHRIDPATIQRRFPARRLRLEAESNLLRNPADDHSKSVFDPAIRGKTDRVVYRFRKPRK